MPDELYLVKVPLFADRLVAIARRRALRLRDLDDGYLSHCILRELWQERAPTPFVLRGRGRVLDAWGYSQASAPALIDHARVYGDPFLLSAVGDLEGITSKTMPLLEKGRRVGFVLRACPVVRLVTGRNGHRAGAEVDAFLARCFAAGQATPVSREEVYRDWIRHTLGKEAISGVRLERVSVAGMSRERLVRRTHGEARVPSRIERPDVRFEGDLEVVDGSRLLAYLAHGVGRHRSFGFGALMLVPPASSRGT